MAKRGAGWQPVAPLMQLLDAFFSFHIFLHAASLPLSARFLGQGLPQPRRCVHCLAQQVHDAVFGTLSPGVAQTAAIILSLEFTLP